MLLASWCLPHLRAWCVLDEQIRLDYLHEPGILFNLSSRFAEDQIYTYSGSILISVNPYKKIPLYGEKQINLYHDVPLGDLPPHVFALADEAFRLMLVESKTQSILISGESGSGKTEAAKQVMNFLASKGKRSTSLQKRLSQVALEDWPVSDRVLASNPLLEAFGNAKTVRNNNSSRFGKYIELLFDSNAQIDSARIHTYLLERSRVVHLNSPERNYHIFYQLLNGMSDEQAANFRLTGVDGDKYGPEDFFYTNQSECFEIGEDNFDAVSFAETCKAMQILGIKEEDQEQILRVLAAILHLGNIDFVEDDQHADRASKLADEESLESAGNAAAMLQVEREVLQKALMTRKIQTVEGILVKEMEAEEARESRDALAKKIYSQIFEWLVRAVNSAIDTGVNDRRKKMGRSIGILDIYGFESFEQNSFEQLCINLANEKLQQQFNFTVFKREQEEYRKEKIDWSDIAFEDNQIVLDLIEKQPGGLLSIIDDQCRLPQANHQTLYEEFSQRLARGKGKHPRFDLAKRDPTGFVIHHYAGPVSYRTQLLLEKNKDYAIQEHVALIESSASAFLQSVFLGKESNLNVSSRKARGRSQSAQDLTAASAKAQSGMKLTTVAMTFKEELTSLMAELNRAHPHYIRCIKPNAEQVSNKFSSPMVIEQLRCGGVMEAVRISCAGFPTRRTYEEFASRYRMLSDMKDKGLQAETGIPAQDMFRMCSLQVIKNVQLKGYQAGRTQIFLKQGQLAVLETFRNNALADKATFIQKIVKGRVERKRYRALKASAIVIQSSWRGCVGRRIARGRRAEREAELAALAEAERERQRIAEEEERLRLEAEERQRQEEEARKRAEEERVRLEQEEHARALAAARAQAEVEMEKSAEIRELRDKASKVETLEGKLEAQERACSNQLEELKESKEQIVTSTARVATLEAELKASNEAVMALEQEVEMWQDKYNQTETRLSDVANELALVRSESNSLSSKMEAENAEMKDALQALEISFQNEHSNMSSTKAALDEAHAEMLSLSNDLAAVRSELSKARRETNSLKLSKDQLEVLAEERQAHLERAEQEMRETQRAANKSRGAEKQEILELKGAIQQAQSLNQESERRLTLERSRVESLKGTVVSLEEELSAAFTASATSVETVNALSRERDVLHASKKKMQAELEDAREELKEVRQELENVKTRSPPKLPAGEVRSMAAALELEPLRLEVESLRNSLSKSQAQVRRLEIEKNSAAVNVLCAGTVRELTDQLADNERARKDLEEERDALKERADVEAASLRKEIFTLQKAKARMQAAVTMFSVRQRLETHSDLVTVDSEVDAVKECSEERIEVSNGTEYPENLDANVVVSPVLNEIGDQNIVETPETDGISKKQPLSDSSGHIKVERDSYFLNALSLVRLELVHLGLWPKS
eukprot:scaffold1947_cov207-Prasinococcus_capsulatus_cf.AAC.32